MPTDTAQPPPDGKLPRAVRADTRAPFEFYHFGRDPGETQDVAAANPSVVAQIVAFAAKARALAGDAAVCAREGRRADPARRPPWQTTAKR